MYTLLLSLSICFFGNFLEAKPSQIILLRHAEKDEASDNLSKRGFERAAALVPFFTQAPFLTVNHTPVAIFAQPASKNYPSLRPVQTITPLAKYLGIIPNTHYTKKDYSEMCKEILKNPLYNEQLVIICWSKDDLSAIATKLGVSGLKDWPGKEFDRIGLITYNATTAVFLDLPQQLLFGDSAL